MDDVTKERALEKAKGMVEHIGYPQGKIFGVLFTLRIFTSRPFGESPYLVTYRLTIEVNTRG